VKLRLKKNQGDDSIIVGIYVIFYPELMFSSGGEGNESNDNGGRGWVQANADDSGDTQADDFYGQSASDGQYGSIVAGAWI
jgi:hypothetical protein